MTFFDYLMISVVTFLLASAVAKAAPLAPLRIGAGEGPEIELESGSMRIPGITGKAIFGPAKTTLPAGCLKSSGTIGFYLWSENNLRPLSMGEKEEAQLLSAEGLELGLVQSDNDIRIPFDIGPFRANGQLTHIKAKRWYHIAYTWDSSKKAMTFHLNGVPQGNPYSRTREGEIAEAAMEARIGAADFAIDGLCFWPRPLSTEEIQSEVAELLPLGEEGMVHHTKKLDVASLRGELLYECKFDSETKLKDWVMEGPAQVKIEEGRLIYSNPEGHAVYWLKKQFPSDILIEWQFAPTQKEGLTIIFFAARPSDGKGDVLRPDLAPRDGTFVQYTKGDTDSYHCSYFTYQRGSVNLRKNSGFKLLAIGPNIIGPEHIGKLQDCFLVKRGGHIIVGMNGRVNLEHDDSHGPYGPQHGGGMVGLRQMAHTVTGIYDNFRVWSLAPGAKISGRE